MSLSVRKLTNRIGAVIEGVDIAAQPSGEVIAALRGALNEYKVIIFDGVELDDPGLPSGESAALLRIFQSYVTRPENLVRWSWSPNQLLIFDNRITQHYAIDNYDDWPRRLNRVTVTGDVPTSVDGRRSRQLVGDASHYSRILETAA